MKKRNIISCKKCGKKTNHRPKMDAFKNGNMVCNECDSENPIRQISEEPQQWIVLKISYEEEIIYRVFAGWRGGYLDGDRWKMNSGITRIEEDITYYYFYGYSGSCYKCRKNQYAFIDDINLFSAYVTSTLERIVERIKESGIGDIETLPNTTNWIELLKN